MRGARVLACYAAALSAVALSLPAAVVAWLAALPFDRDRRAPSAVLRLLARALVALCPLWRVSVEGTPPRAGAFVVVPNHQSMVDALAIGFFPGEVKWMGKRSAFRFPWLGWSFHVAGYVPVLRGDSESGARALARLRRYLDAGIAVGVFPEGTRSAGGAVLPFRPGPFKLAIDAGVPVVPVAIAGAGRALAKGGLAVRASEIRMRILPPLATSGLGRGDVDALREEARRRVAAAIEELARARA